MAIKTRKEAESSIVMQKYAVRGKQYTRYVCDVGSYDGKKIRISSPTFIDTRDRIAKWYDEHGAMGNDVLRLTQTQLSDAVFAYSLLERAGCRRTLAGIVEEYLASSKSKVNPKGILEAFDEWLARLTPEQTAEAKFDKNRVGNFVALYPTRKVHEIRYEDILRFLKPIDDPTTYNQCLKYIRTFFNWCGKKHRRYCAENPIEELELRPVPHKMPEFAKVSEVKRLFKYLLNTKSSHRDLYIYHFALACFCGMRTGETARTMPEDVRLDEGSVLVREPKGHTKGIAHRTFQPMPNAVEWLRLCDMGKVRDDLEKYKHSRRESLLQSARLLSHAVLPDNFARHSFITYHVALYNNPALTEGIAGTSKGMRENHYQGLATKAQAEEYFSITPASLAEPDLFTASSVSAPAAPSASATPCAS